MSLTLSARLAYLKAKAGLPSMTEALMEEPFYFPTWPISPTEGRKIIKRQFNFCGYSVEMAGPINWYVREAGIDWHRNFFSYVWLQDIASINNEKTASSFAREFINAFTLISKIDRVHETAWEMEVVGERLTHWLYYRHFVLRGGSRTFCKRFQKSLATHVEELATRMEQLPDSLGPNALKGLIAASTIIPHCAFLQDKALTLLAQLITRDILPDGGHISQNPGYQLAFIKSLIEIRDILESANSTFDPLNDAISSLGEMLQFYCHGDGRLTVFGQNLMEDVLVIARAIELSYDRKPPPVYAKVSGYIKLIADTALLFVRTGAAQDKELPLGIGAMEFSDKEERFIVNCGMYYGANAQWHQALAHASAFSTISLQSDAVQLLKEPTATRALDEKTSRRQIELRYPLTSALLHERHISLDNDGVTLKGRELFVLQDGYEADVLKDMPALVARFHLHPDIRVQSNKQSGYSLTSLNGIRWLFSCNLPKYITVEESVYLGYYGKPQKTLQLCVTIPAMEWQGGLQWELKKQI